MRIRFAMILGLMLVAIAAIYNVCHESGGAVDTVVGMARRITYGALFAIGFTGASVLLRKYMSQPVRPLAPVLAAPPVPTFPMHSEPGAGMFRVRGVDHDTRFETVEMVFADSPGNAKLKVELKGVDVAVVERA